MTLTYNNKKTFSTTSGGVLTLCSAALIVYWIIVTILQYAPSPVYTVTSKQNLVPVMANARETYDITWEDLVPINRIVTSNHTVFPNEDLSTYVSIVYRQKSYDLTTNSTSYSY